MSVRQGGKYAAVLENRAPLLGPDSGIASRDTATST